MPGEAERVGLAKCWALCIAPPGHANLHPGLQALAEAAPALPAGSPGADGVTVPCYKAASNTGFNMCKPGDGLETQPWGSPVGLRGEASHMQGKTYALVFAWGTPILSRLPCAGILLPSKLSPSR